MTGDDDTERGEAGGQDADIRHEDGIVVVAYPPGVRVDRAMAERTFRRRLALLRRHGKRRQRLLMLGSRITAFEYGALKFSAGREVTDTIGAAAVVCRTTLERHLTSVFMNMFRPSYPIRVFEDVDAARQWLATFPDE